MGNGEILFPPALSSYVSYTDLKVHGYNIHPISTLQKMEASTEQVHGINHG